MVGATPCKIQVVLSHKVLKIHLIQEIIHFSVFIPIHHSFGFPDIFLEGGVSRPQRPPLDPPLIYASVESGTNDAWTGFT